MGNLVDTVLDRGGLSWVFSLFYSMPFAIMGLLPQAVERREKKEKKKEEAKKKKELVCWFLVTGWCLYIYFSQAAAARKEKEKVKKVVIHFAISLCFVTLPLLSSGGKEEKGKP